MTRMRGRRGATLVLVAALLTVIFGMAGVAIDMSRLYVMRAQLQTTADATAIAGIVEVKDKRPTNAPTAALAYAPLNQVERQTPTLTAGNVEGGKWDFATNTFTPLASWTDPALNAVRTTPTYQATYSLARVFGVTTRTVQARAVAALGFVGTSDCLRPWAVSYQTILNSLYPPAGSKDPSYNLTAQDIQTLTGMSYPADSITLLQGTSNQLTPGNISQVVVNNPWNGNNSYKNAINGCSNLPIGPGTWLDGDAGVGGGQTAGALRQFCQANGGVQGGGQNYTCTGQPKIKLAMWDQSNGSPGSNLQLRVKYVGVFAIVGFKGGSGPDQIAGYFTSMASTGGFSANPTPITGSIALVQ
jgi:Flp pilus assembly protein TadG